MSDVVIWCLDLLLFALAEWFVGHCVLTLLCCGLVSLPCCFAVSFLLVGFVYLLRVCLGVSGFVWYYVLALPVIWCLRFAWAFKYFTFVYFVGVVLALDLCQLQTVCWVLSLVVEFTSCRFAGFCGDWI